MAIVQISRITNRKGLQENLPQLAGAELGWSIDERRLFIGNGTLQEGAPVIGNTVRHRNQISKHRVGMRLLKVFFKIEFTKNHYRIS